MNKIERFARQIRDDAIHQECVFHVCDSTQNAKKAADLIESQQTEIAGLRKESKTSKIPCALCGGKVIEFSVPNDLWNYVTRPDGKETDKEYLCFGCWNKAIINKFTDLRAQLAESEKRAKAAIEAMENIVDGKDYCKLCEYYAKCEQSNTTHCGNFIYAA